MSDTSVHMTEIDQLTNDSTAQLLKAALPYTNNSVARLLTVAAKCLELKKALAYLQKPQSEISICAVPGQHTDTEEMLKDLRKYCNASQVEMIDRMLNILQMGKFYEKYKELESSPEFSNMMSMFKAMSAATQNQSAPRSHAPGAYAAHTNDVNAASENTGFAPNDMSSVPNDMSSAPFPENLSLPPNFDSSMQNASRILDMLIHQTNNSN